MNSTAIEDESRGQMVVWLEEITAGDTPRVGGKGANLGECARAGLPVPPGFCVTAAAYAEATASVTSQLVADASQGAASAARQRVLALSLPESMQAAICAAYANLGGVPVAVRSSATAEDLADASFAGQQDTYLGVSGADAVLDAVRRCWGSLWTDRAVEYRRQQGVADDGLALAVVVQAMVASDTAGVLFTRNPVTGDETSMLASSAYGLGESVVAALVTPDTFTLSRTPSGVVSREIGSKLTRIDVAADGGTTTSEVPINDQARQSLRDDQLQRLVELGKRVESHYGSGQDIEWAFVGDELYLLQARPITTNAEITEGHAPANGRLERALRDDLIEHFPAPFPLDLYAVHRVQDAIQDLMATAGLNAVSASSLIQGDDEGIIRITITKPRPTMAIVTHLPTLFISGMRHDPSRWPSEEGLYCRQLDELAHKASERGSASDRDVVALVRDAVAHAATVTAERFVRYNAPMIVNRALASGIMKLTHHRSQITPEDLYAGVPYKTAEITSAINELAATARETGVASLVTEAAQGAVDDALSSSQPGRDFLTLTDQFLSSYGARTARLYLPFSNRSWREDREAFYALLAATLRGTPHDQSYTANAAERIENQLPRVLRRRWRINTARLQAQHIGREGTLYLIEEFFCTARTGINEIADRLVSRQQLDRTDDIRFLYLEEIETALRDKKDRLQSIVVRRRRKRGAAEAVWWDRGQVIENRDVLRGLPASSGRAAGTARVIRSPDEFHRLQPGDILICPYTDPTWTSLFTLAAAVVADSGGPLSHAAIVAREYGIPAVLGTGNATSLPDGAQLLVDGTNGTVTIDDRHDS